MPKANRPTESQIDLDALSFNFQSIRSFIGEGSQFMAVVKADGYGHGAVACARRLALDGVDWFGVALVEEAMELRNAGIETPILTFGSFWAGQESALLEQSITTAIFDLERASILNAESKRRGQTSKVHIKIDTGMGRIGVPFRDIPEFAQGLREFEYLDVEGLMTHFATADDLANDFTNEQMRRFAEVVAVFHANGFRPTIIDMANSPGAIAFKDSRASMVRIGGILYGLGDDVLPQGIDRPGLKPVMSLTTQIAFLKRVNKGESVGYGQTWIADRDSMIATIPIGYHDGLPRSLSNKGRVLVNGEFASVVGRVSMDWTTIDVTDIPSVSFGDEVVVIGEQRHNRITAEMIAAQCDTISYEITCGIGSRVPRIFKFGSL